MARRALDFVDASDPDVERIWRSLEPFAPASYFLSWAWIRNWLAALPSAERPALAVVHDGHETQAAFFLAQRKVRRGLFTASTALFFNATGLPRRDDVGIAHNTLLAIPGACRSLANILELLPGAWDELHLPALDRTAFDDLTSPRSRLATHYQITLERDDAATLVDLATARTHPITAGLTVEVATDAAHAQSIHAELRHLDAPHDTWCDDLHHALIADRLATGDIQLMRVSAAGTTLGCLYNFVYRGRVQAYQAGFAGDSAFACHAAAVAYNTRAGYASYELLPGHAEHADALATGVSPLVWLRVQRPVVRLASSFEGTARRWYSALVNGVNSPLAVT